MKPQALYRFFDTAGALLYVGITLDPGSRWKQHRDDKPWWLEVANVTIETFPDRASVLEAERTAIVAERPRYNVVHNRTGRLEVVDAPVIYADDVAASEMPDMCHDYCVFANPNENAMYYPYRWRDGTAWYQCRRGHTWTCGWGVRASGRADENRGLDQALALNITAARKGRRVAAIVTRVARTSTVLTAEIWSCPFCGRRHTHGLGADVDGIPSTLGARSSHCQNGTYFLELADGVVGPHRRSLIGSTP